MQFSVERKIFIFFIMCNLNARFNEIIVYKNLKNLFLIQVLHSILHTLYFSFSVCCACCKGNRFLPLSLFSFSLVSSFLSLLFLSLSHHHSCYSSVKFLINFPFSPFYDFPPPTYNVHLIFPFFVGTHHAMLIHEVVFLNEFHWNDDICF